MRERGEDGLLVLRRALDMAEAIDDALRAVEEGRAHSPLGCPLCQRVIAPGVVVDSRGHVFDRSRLPGPPVPRGVRPPEQETEVMS